MHQFGDGADRSAEIVGRFGGGRDQEGEEGCLVDRRVGPGPGVGQSDGARERPVEL